MSKGDVDRIVVPLVKRVRMLSREQIVTTWYGGHSSNAGRATKKLKAAGLINQYTVMARQLPKLEQPVVTWSGEEVALDPGAVAYAIANRWEQIAPRKTTLYVATRRASQLLGGKGAGKPKSVLQCSHDLAVSWVYLFYARASPATADRWRSEDLLCHTRGHCEKVPDAFMVDDDENIECVIELGGCNYDRDRVEAFITDCLERNPPLPFEIW